MAKPRNPRTLQFLEKKKQFRGIRGFARLYKLYKWLSTIDFQKLQIAGIARFDDSQILQSQKPPKWEALQNANVGKFPDLRNCTKSKGG